MNLKTTLPILFLTIFCACDPEDATGGGFGGDGGGGHGGSIEEGIGGNAGSGGGSDDEIPNGLTYQENPEPEDAPVPDIYAGLFVSAGGEIIGRLDSIGEWSIRVWDEEKGLVFSVNESTGNVVGPYVHLTANIYDQADCEGVARDSALIYSSCDPIQLSRKFVYRDDLDYFGSQPSENLYVKSDTPAEYWPLSIQNHDVCHEVSSTVPYCGFEYEITEEIPTSFPLPIGIEEVSFDLP